MEQKTKKKSSLSASGDEKQTKPENPQFIVPGMVVVLRNTPILSGLLSWSTRSLPQPYGGCRGPWTSPGPWTITPTTSSSPEVGRRMTQTHPLRGPAPCWGGRSPSTGLDTGLDEALPPWEGRGSISRPDRKSLPGNSGRAVPTGEWLTMNITVCPFGISTLSLTPDAQNYTPRVYNWEGAMCSWIVGGGGVGCMVRKISVCVWRGWNAIAVVLDLWTPGPK